QEGEESVGAYSCRLEDILNKAIARGAVAREQGDEMLRIKDAYSLPRIDEALEAMARLFVVHNFGPQKRILADRGRRGRYTDGQHLQTTPYHPMGNGMCERFNRTLLHMLGTLGKEQKANWKDFVAPVVHAYNATKHESTGVSPFYLMFGRHPRLAIDVQFGHDPNGFPRKKHSVFVDDLRKRLDYAYKLAKVKAKSSAERQKKTYDGRKPTSNKLSPGDKVLVKNVTPKGKLDNFWEDDIYIVVRKSQFIKSSVKMEKAV
ncbi:hypothetical protein QZH41_009796, partial [Actinostola sp. cb2023]